MKRGNNILVIAGLMLLSILYVAPFSTAAPIPRVINVSTEIDKNKFSNGEFLVVKFIPDRLTAIFDKDTHTFRDLSSNFSVNTNLQTTEANTGFSIFLTENKLTCLNTSDEIITLVPTSDSADYGFVKLTVNGTSIRLGESISISSFNIENNNQWEGSYPANLSFSALAASNLPAGKCSGNISVRVEFNI